MMFKMKQLEKIGRGWRGAGSDDFVDGFHLAEEAWGEAASDVNSGLLAFAYLWRRFGPPFRGGDDYKDLVSYLLTTPDPDVVLWLHLSGSDLRLAAGYLAKASLRKPDQLAARKWERDLWKWWFKQHPEFEEWEDTEHNQAKAMSMFWAWRSGADFSAETPDPLWLKVKSDLPKPPWSKYPRPKDWRKGPPLMRRVNKSLIAAMKELLRPVYIRDVPINLFGRCDDSKKPADVSEFAGYGVPLGAMRRLIAK